MKKVTLVIIAPLKANLEKNRRAYESAFNQDYPNYDVMIHFEKPTEYNDIFKDKYKNCSENREIARKMALSSDSDYFLFKDWDIVYPKNAITEFMKQTGKRMSMPYRDPETNEIFEHGKEVPEIHIQGGWYPIYASLTGEFSFYVAGRYIDFEVIARLTEVEKSLVPVDYVGCGCLFISREALSNLHFESGLDKIEHDNYGNCIYLGEGAAFGKLARSKGYSMMMNGSVVCEHIRPWRLKCSSLLISTIRRLPRILQPVGMRIWSRIMSVDLSPIQKLEGSSH